MAKPQFERIDKKEIESKHEYLPNSNILLEHVFEGATKLQFKFDSRCNTESGYDKLRISKNKSGGEVEKWYQGEA